MGRETIVVFITDETKKVRSKVMQLEAKVWLLQFNQTAKVCQEMSTNLAYLLFFVTQTMKALNPVMDFGKVKLNLRLMRSEISLGQA